MEFYHYRSIYSALKEIEGTFYFASREELNDPMESYLQVYWQGDKAAWEGLFRNYICSLYYAFTLYTLAIYGNKLRKKTLIVDIDRFDNVPLGKILEEIGKEFLAERDVQDISSLCSDKLAKVRKKELKTLIRIVHYKALAICIRKSINNGTVNKECYERVLKLITDIIDKLDDSPYGKKVELLRRIDDKERSIIFSFCEDSFNDFIESCFLKIGICINENFLYGSMIHNEKKNLNRSCLSEKDSESIQRRNWFTLMNDFPKNYVEQLVDILYPKSYVVCFSASNSNSAMWGKYAESHAGVCLIYECNDKQEILIDHKFDGKKYPLKFQKVIYGGEVEKRNFFETLGILTLAQVKRWFAGTNGLSKCFDVFSNDEDNWRTQYWKTFDTKIRQKLESWSYEEEYRLIIEDSFYNYPSSEDRKLKYDLKALKGIIFGIKTSEYDKCQIIKKILKNEKIGDDFKFWQAEYNDEKQIIEIREKLWKLKDFRGKVVSKDGKF